MMTNAHVDSQINDEIGEDGGGNGGGGGGGVVGDDEFSSLGERESVGSKQSGFLGALH